MMKIKTIINVGLSNDEYEQLKLPVAKLNMKTLQWASLLTAVLMLALARATMSPFFSSLAMNRYAYIVMGLSAAAVFLATVFFLPRNLRFVKIVFYLFLTVVVAFGIYIGIITNTNGRASTICVLLLAIPLLITDKPYRISLFLIASTFLFAVASYRFKEYNLFVGDVVNCFCILVISVALNFANQNIKYRSLNDRHTIEQNNLRLIHQQEAELEESRIAIMLSQIQPHFLYNALTAIARLCEIEPQKAKKTTLDFSEYLRGNLDSLSQKMPILFSEELKHTKIYTDIEEIRFGDKLHIAYDICTDDFFIPSLTVQPLVENAVKHGVGKKSDGGTVRISTRESVEGWYVNISDDGVGFDACEAQNDGRTHIGIENVRRRLALQCGGKLTIASVPGSGTTSEIFIPRGEKGK